jgi:hypothetical protein
LKILGESTTPTGERWYRVRISDGRECWIVAKAVEVN